jgi:hypothetical protein
MLSDRCYQLLTAYVDGELSARQRRAVQRLLRGSPEARALLRQLQDDAEALRRLPRRRLDPDFSFRVLTSLHERGLVHRQRLAQLQTQPFPAWVGMALAASVLFLVGFGSYFYFLLTLPDHRGNPVALSTAPHGPSEEGVLTPGPDGAASQAKVDRPPAEQRKPRQPPPPSTVAQTPSDKPSSPREPAADPTPEMALTLPVPEKEMFQPQAVEMALPAIFQFGDLIGTRLRDELRKDSGFRLEVPCRDSSRAFERLQSALKTHGINLLIDQVAQSRLKHKLQTNFVLYAEDLLPEELAAILQQVGSDDRKAESKRKGDGLFDGLVVTRMTKDDRKELSTLLGVDPRQVQSPRAGTPLGVDPKKPLSEMTAEQVAQALTTSRSEANRSSGKAPEHLAVVLPYNPVRPRPGSAEVKRFLESRRPPRIGTVQVLLVLRETKR